MLVNQFSSLAFNWLEMVTTTTTGGYSDKAELRMYNETELRGTIDRNVDKKKDYEI